MKSNKNFIRTLAAALLCSGFLTACGGGSSDTTPPTISDVSPDSDDSIMSTRVTLIGTATDDRQLAGVDIELNGALTSTTVELDAFSATLDLKAGLNNYTVVATDLAGNQTRYEGELYLGHRVAAANSHSGALTNGKLYTWGRNNYGQTGLGFYSALSDNPDIHPTSPEPVPTPGDTTFVALSFGQNHSLAIDSQGRLWSWGKDSDGQLGRGDDNWSDCGLSGSTARICRMGIGQVADWTDVVTVSAGLSHVLVLRADGTVWAFGSNDSGALGLDPAIEQSNTPVQVAWSADDVAAGNVGRIIQIAAGSRISLALDDKGQLWAWGRNSYGNLGQGFKDSDAHPTPILVPAPPPEVAGSSRIVAVATGNNHILALDDKGQVYAWGNNASSQVGFNGYLYKGTAGAWESPMLSPRQLPAFINEPAVAVYANGNTSYARRADGKVYPWGQWGITGADGKTSYANLDEAEDRLASLVDGGASGIGGTKSIIDLAVGSLFSVAMRNDSGLFSWGWSFEGSLGGGDTTTDRWMYHTPITPVLP